jgi:copper(I)-binding protein
MNGSLKAAALAAILAAPAVGFAHHAGEVFRLGDEVMVSHAWTEETGETSHSVDVFLTIENQGDAAVRLVAATTGFSDAGRFQAPVLGDDGALAIREVPAIEVAPGQTVTFQPGGVHIVLPNVKQGFEGGEHFDMTLDFGEAGTVAIEVEVEHHDGEAEHDHDEPES